MTSKECIEMMQYRDDKGWTCLMYRAYATKTPKMPFVKVLIRNDENSQVVNMSIAQGEINKKECKKLIGIARELYTQDEYA